MPCLNIKLQATLNQCLVLSVCKTNTISSSYLSDSIPLLHPYGGDRTKGILVKCVMKCRSERKRGKLKLPSMPRKHRETFTLVKSYISLRGRHDEIKPCQLSAVIWGREQADESAAPTEWTANRYDFNKIFRTHTYVFSPNMATQFDSFAV